MDRQKSIFLRKSVLLLLFLLFCAGSVTQAQKRFTEEDEAKIRNQILKIEEEKDKLLPHEKKTESNLRDLIKQMRDDQSKGILEGRSASKKYTNPSANVNEKLQIQIVVSLRNGKDADSTAVKEEIASAGGYTRLVYKGGDSFPVEMYCWVPFNKILEIAKNASIGNVSLLGQPEVRVGAKTTDGFSQLNADKVYQYFGLDGTIKADNSRVKIGVISNGIKGLNNSISSGDLNSIYTVNSGDPNENEGTAMMEIIHDIAPNADLYFAGLNKTSGPNDMASRIDQLKNSPNYCKIIVDDVGFPYDSPQFSDDALASTVTTFKNDVNTKCYISAAGNFGENCWDGVFTKSLTDGYNVWYRSSDNGDYTGNTIQVATGETVDIILQWADKWGQARTDYDLYLVDVHSKNVVKQSINSQTDAKSQDYDPKPRERITFTNQGGNLGSFNVMVKLKGSSSEPDKEMRLIVKNITNPNNSKLTLLYPNFPTNPGRPTGQVFGKELKSTVTVGAYSASSPNTIEPYSSRGPSNYYSFDGYGNPIGPTPYQVPAIIATDHVQTNAGSPFDTFNGTSAAAPHVAGIAALFYSKYPNGNFYQALTQSAVSIAGGTGGAYNGQSGFGKADALGCLLNPLTLISPGTISSPVSWTDVRVNGTVTINPDIVVTVPDKSIAVINGTVNFGNANSKIVVNAGGTLLVRKDAIVNASYLTGNVIYEKYLLVDQVAEDNSSLGSVPFGRWEGGYHFATYNSPKYFCDLNINDNVVLQANQGVNSGKKYRFWKKNNGSTGSIINHQSFSYDNPITELGAVFTGTNNATIQSKLIDGGNPGGALKFMDPWLIDYPDPLYASTLRNQGMTASFKDVNYSANNLGPNTAYKGMFLDFDPSQGAQFFYSVQAPMVQNNINGKTGYFQDWSTSNATLQQNGANPSGYDQKAVVFNGDNAVLTTLQTSSCPFSTWSP